MNARISSFGKMNGSISSFGSGEASPYFSTFANTTSTLSSVMPTEE